MEATLSGTYVPNLNNSKYAERTLKRIKQGFGWAMAVLNDEPRELAKTWIDDNLGQQQNPLSKWLRTKLLRCTDSHFSFGSDSVCKKYTLNRAGVDEVRSVLLGADPTAATLPLVTTTAEFNESYDLQVVQYWVVHAYGKELETLEFNYEEKESARLWHPLQNLRKAAKKQVWESVGLTHNYDIKACAPTLILQHAQRLGMDEWLFGIDDYLKNTAAFRQHIADIANIPVKDAKVLVNALFCGARLGASKEFALFELVDFDRQKMTALQEDTRLTRLREDIKKCWQAIEPSMPTAYTDKGRKLPLNSRRKWGRYFELEREVLNVIRAELQRAGIKCFLEHDGWRSDKAVDLAAMEELVFLETGYRVTLVK
ncbi:hypothetical protein [Burkholderia vietnamiensis]|uniref:hypothetical protein n=1 Tax=Burkholderia vietnamiensis TaxID=60552 RepID=UPI001588F8B8|nr:hypothetical protein [Burkholderia vietnamiensis]